MSRRRKRPDGLEEVHTVRITCARGHRKRTAAMLEIDREIVDLASYDGIGPMPTAFRQLGIDGPEIRAYDVYTNEDDELAIKPRWRCGVCGLSVTLAAHRADLIVHGWATRGVTEVDLQRLSRLLSGQ